jgi:hypothetical protein
LNAAKLVEIQGELLLMTITKLIIYSPILIESRNPISSQINLQTTQYQSHPVATRQANATLTCKDQETLDLAFCLLSLRFPMEFKAASLDNSRDGNIESGMEASKALKSNLAGNPGESTHFFVYFSANPHIHAIAQLRRLHTRKFQRQTASITTRVLRSHANAILATKYSTPHPKIKHTSIAHVRRPKLWS